MDTKRIIWAAGLYEGEGSISCVSRGVSEKALSLKITMTDRDVLESFKETFSVGNVFGPYGVERTNLGEGEVYAD